MTIIEQSESVIKELANIIANKTKYPEVSVSYSQAYTTIKDYMSTSLLLKSHYTGTTSAEAQQTLGNVFTKVIYLKQKGLVSEKDVNATNFDVALRDRIWVILSLIRENALANNRYAIVWKPYVYATESTAPETPSYTDRRTPTEPAPVQTGIDWLWIAGGIGLLLLLA